MAIARQPKPVTEPIDVSDDLRVEGGGRGRPLSQLTLDLIEGKTKLVPFETNPENFRKTLRDRGFRLRTAQSADGRGILMWCDEIEPVKKGRGRK